MFKSKSSVSRKQKKDTTEFRGRTINKSATPLRKIKLPAFCFSGKTKINAQYFCRPVDYCVMRKKYCSPFRLVSITNAGPTDPYPRETEAGSQEK